MRWLISLLLFCVSLAATKADPQFENPYYQNNYPVAYPNPNYDQDFLPYAIQPPHFAQENRIFWSQLTSLFVSTTTTTTTTTTTCTVSTAKACRRRRFLIDELRGEDENIEPTSVNKFITTEVANFESLERKEREAKPQFNDFWRVGGVNYPPYEIQPTFGSRYYPANLQAPHWRQQVSPFDPRLFIKFIVTSTITSTTTSQSTPTCSTTSSFNKC